MPGALTRLTGIAAPHAALSPENPITAEQFAGLMQDLPLGRSAAVAVSGGADSMALAFCLRRWGGCDLTALIVDHGLRDDSTLEATQTAADLQKLGIDSRILYWRPDPDLTRLHERARAARYGLMTRACQELGIGDLLLAHHRDDQAETILMRLCKGSGPEGLAGMARISARDDLRLLRPLLGVAKPALLATCLSAGIAFISDPSNGDARFARGRLRRIMPLLAAEGLSVDALLNLGARAGEHAEAVRQAATEFLLENSRVGLAGQIILTKASLQKAPTATAVRALILCFAFIRGELYPPPRAGLLSLLQEAKGQAVFGRSLQGCLVTGGGEKLTVTREPAAATEKCSLTGPSLIWDQRWRVTARHGWGQATYVGALGVQPHAVIDRLNAGLRRILPQGRLRAALPALWQSGERNDKLIAIPSFDAEAPISMHLCKQSFP